MSWYRGGIILSLAGRLTHNWKDPKNLELLNWHWVGRYALSIQWSDGHDMGIYTFDYLRKLCNEQEEI
jgi:DUF971 family protein